MKQKFRIVEWRNDYCTLRFKTTQPAGEELDLRFLVRFREPVKRGKRTIRGKIPDYRNGGKQYGQTGMQHAESFNEVKALWIVVPSAHADVTKVQPFQLLYRDGDKRRHYVPDILLGWGDEFWVGDVKDDRRGKLAEEELQRFSLIQDLLTTHRFNFFLWARSAICEEPRLRIAKDILEYQCCEVPPMERERIRRLFREINTIRLRNLSDDETRSVLALVPSGLLHIDWWQNRLSKDTLVSVSPLGRQEWPNDRSKAALERAAGKLR